jgi:hypothetical protein
MDGRSSAYLLGVLGVLAEAPQQAGRAWVVADYQAPPGVALAGVIELGL